MSSKPRISSSRPRFAFEGTLMALALARCSTSCIPWHTPMIRSIEEFEFRYSTRIIAFQDGRTTIDAPGVPQRSPKLPKVWRLSLVQELGTSHTSTYMIY